MKFGLLGEKLGHSLSPFIHEELYKAIGLEASYELIEVLKEELGIRVQELSKTYVGLNVTIPHKVEVMKALTEVEASAIAIGAVNTIHFTEKGIYGYNTDYFGFAKTLEYNHIDVKGKQVVVLGTGGASRAIICCLENKGAAKIILVTRSISTVPEDFKEKTTQTNFEICTYEQEENLTGDLIVNCTPVGMYPNVGVSPISEEIIKRFVAAIDLIYNPQETEFLKLARVNNKKAVNGLLMLVAQAIKAEEIWLGRTFEDKLAIAILKKLEEKLYL